jgi:hypothetical protein
LTDHQAADVVSMAAFFAFATAYFDAIGADATPILGSAAVLLGTMWLLPRVERVADWLKTRRENRRAAEGEA